MRRTAVFVSLLVAFVVYGQPSKPPKPITAIVLKCAATDTKGWSSPGGALDVDIDYWVEGGCTAWVTGKPATGEPLTGPNHGAGPLLAPEHFPAVVSTAFNCSGNGGKCYFRVRKVASAGTTIKTEEEIPAVGFECQAAKQHTIYNGSLCDVVVRVNAPPKCAVSVSADGGTPVTFKNEEKFVSFGQVKKVTALCEGKEGSGKCKFELRAFCP